MWSESLRGQPREAAGRSRRARRCQNRVPCELPGYDGNLPVSDVTVPRPVDVLQELPGELMEDVLGAMEAQDRERLSRALALTRTP